VTNASSAIAVRESRAHVGAAIDTARSHCRDPARDLIVRGGLVRRTARASRLSVSIGAGAHSKLHSRDSFVARRAVADPVGGQSRCSEVVRHRHCTNPFWSAHC